MTEIQIVPLETSDREQFIRDNQEAFNYGALEEFGQRDDHATSYERVRLFFCKIYLFHILRHTLKHHPHNSFRRSGVVVQQPFLCHANAAVAI